MAHPSLAGFIKKNISRFKNYFSFLGLSLILIGFFSINTDRLFPRYWALIPAVGTVFIISFGHASFINKILLNRSALVFIGLISYPLYLWHWPLISFSRIVSGEEPTSLFKSTLLLIAFLLSWLTFKYVEKPIKKHNSYKVVTVLIALAFFIALSGWSIHSNDGYSNRQISIDQKEVREQIVGTTWVYTENTICKVKYPSGFRYFCSQEKEGAPTVILIGDSYANHLYAGLVENNDFSEQNILSYGSCSPGTQLIDCNVHKQIIINNPTVKYALINFLWPRLNSDGVSLDLITGKRKNDRNTGEIYEDYLDDIVTFLLDNGVTPILFHPKPEINYDISSCFSRPLATSARDCTVKKEEVSKQQEGILAVINRIAIRYPQAYAFNQNQIFCDFEATCSLIKNGLPLLRDKGHYSIYGSKLLMSEFSHWARSNKLSIISY